MTQLDWNSGGHCIGTRRVLRHELQNYCTVKLKTDIGTNQRKYCLYASKARFQKTVGPTEKLCLLVIFTSLNVTVRKPMEVKERINSITIINRAFDHPTFIF